MSIASTDVVQELYRTANNTRTDFGGRADDAIRYYAELVQFITRVLPPQSDKHAMQLLDIGCGSGWSSFCFAKLGYQTTGIDLNPRAFEPPPTQGLTLREGSALTLPFEANSFNVVTSYQCIEHLPDPEAALKEMIRVCRPSGIICIVGPNLLSPLLPIKFLVNGVMGGGMRLRRQPQTPRHPYGNTPYEYLRSVVLTTGRLSRKLLGRSVTFTMRAPDTIPPFHGDNDACYLCNPTDLSRFFSSLDCKVLKNGRHGRPPMSHLLAGGTWLAVQKCV